MAYYGLRASEIAALRLDALDWKGATMKVTQRKTRSDLVLPLAPRTLRILQGYLRHERGDGALPYLFLRVRRPTGPLQHYAVCNIFYKRAVQSGLDLDGYASYSLRHSFAMRLLGRNVGIKAIGDLLGHRSLEATCVYLRLDTMALRSVGLPLPLGARRQLKGLVQPSQRSLATNACWAAATTAKREYCGACVISS
jgi:integrase/recombinase XerD